MRNFRIQSPTATNLLFALGSNVESKLRIRPLKNVFQQTARSWSRTFRCFVSPASRAYSRATRRHSSSVAMLTALPWCKTTDKMEQGLCQ